MNSVPRKLTMGLAIALVAAACGDKVTVAGPPTPPTPVVRSVVVSPSSATISPGSSFTFGAAVDADATLSNAVTWSAAGGTGITVDANGVATASATASGVAAICATSTANTAIKGCAQLTITTGPVLTPATVQIQTITVGCSALNVALPGFTACGLGVPVQVNNVGGQIDVTASVQNAHGTTNVVFQVIDADGATVLKSYTQTLAASIIGSADLALQTAATPVTQSINTAEYDLGGTGGAARVFFLNGQKTIRVCLSSVVDSCTGAGQTAIALRTVTFRNANGFHMAITTNLSSGNNANGVAIRQTNAATGLSYVGGTPLALSAIPVSYTGQVAALTPSTFLSFGGGAGCGVQRNVVAVGSGAVLTGTLTYTAGAAAAAGTVNGYEAPSTGILPACTITGEVPFAAALDAAGNPFINFPLAGNYANNTLNNLLNPVVTTLATVSPIRLDDNGPSAIGGYFANPNNRQNGWYNAAVILNVRNASNADGAVGAGGGVDNGIAGAVALQARGGVCASVSSCAALPLRQRVSSDPAPTSAANLPETPLGTSDQFIVQTVDLFGNFTNPGGTNLFGVDITPPTHTVAQSWAAGVTQFNVQLGSAGFGLLPAGQNWTVTANDVAPALPAVASGIRSALGTGSLLFDGLEMTLSTRTAVASNFFCPVNVQFQASNLACTTSLVNSGWGVGTIFGRAPGAAIALDPALVPVNTPAYYQMVVNTIDQAGNRSVPSTATVIFDNVIPAISGLSTTPVPGLGGGTVTNAVGATDNLDLGFVHFGYTYGTGALTPFSSGNVAGLPIYYPMATTGSGQQGVNPVGFNQPGPSILGFAFNQGTTPFMRSLRMVGNVVGGGNLITAPVALADNAGASVLAVASDVAGNRTAAPLAIGITTNAVALPSLVGADPWFVAAAVPPGGIGFTGTFIGTTSSASASLGAGTAAQKTVTLTATATSLATAGWQAPFTLGGLDFWVFDNAPGRPGYVKVCTANTPSYNIGTLSWIYSCTWTAGSQLGTNGYNLPTLGATNFIAIGRNGTGDGLATQPTVITIIL